MIVSWNVNWMFPTWLHGFCDNVTKHPVASENPMQRERSLLVVDLYRSCRFVWIECKRWLQGAPLQLLVFQLGRKVALNLWPCGSFCETWPLRTLIQSVFLPEMCHFSKQKDMTRNLEQLSLQPLCRYCSEFTTHSQTSVKPQDRYEFELQQCDCKTTQARVSSASRDAVNWPFHTNPLLHVFCGMCFLTPITNISRVILLSISFRGSMAVAVVTKSGLLHSLVPAARMQLEGITGFLWSATHLKSSQAPGLQPRVRARRSLESFRADYHNFCQTAQWNCTMP